MNARLSMPAFAVVSSDAKQTARVEVALRTGPAEPERRSDMADDERGDEWQQVFLKRVKEALSKEMLRRESLGGGVGSDKTMPLSNEELAEIETLVDQVHREADRLIQHVVFATNWRELEGISLPTEAEISVLSLYSETPSPKGANERSNQTLFPSIARARLNSLRSALAALRGTMSGDELAKTELVDAIFRESEHRMMQIVGEKLGYDYEHSARDTEIALERLGSSTPQLAKLQSIPELKDLFGDVVREILGEKALRRRDPEAHHKARWLELSHLLATRLDIEVGSYTTWEEWLNERGYKQRRAGILSKVAKHRTPARADKRVQEQSDAGGRKRNRK